MKKKAAVKFGRRVCTTFLAFALVFATALGTASTAFAEEASVAEDSPVFPGATDVITDDTSVTTDDATVIADDSVVIAGTDLQSTDTGSQNDIDSGAAAGITRDGDTSDIADDSSDIMDDNVVIAGMDPQSTETDLLEPSDDSELIPQASYDYTIDLSDRRGGKGYIWNAVMWWDDTNSNMIELMPEANGKSYQIIQSSGEQMASGIIVGTNVNTTIELKDVNMSTVKSPIQLKGNAKIALVLAGNNVLKSNSSAGIVVSENASLTISGTGKLQATGSSSCAGIGGDYNGAVGTIIVNGGTVTTTGGSNGAGIGGGSVGTGGTIIVNGGTVTATGGSSGAGIGGGSGASGGTITITGGKVTATSIGGGANGAGGTITIKDGTVITTTGGIGGGSGASGGVITISGGTIAANSDFRDAGIGGGNGGAGGTINISGGTVKAMGGPSGGSGIGGGYGGAGGTIIIGGGTVTATGGSYVGGPVASGGSGIGGGGFHGAGGTITINGGTVTATGGDTSPGIGGGDGGAGGTITISGGTVTATSEYGAGIGSGKNNDPTASVSISSKASVIAYAKYAVPAINAYFGNDGNGFIVSAYLDKTYSSSLALKVYVNAGTALSRTLALPQNYASFAYTTGSTSAQSDRIFAYSGGTYLGCVERVYDGVAAILSTRDAAPTEVKINPSSVYTPPLPVVTVTFNSNGGSAVASKTVNSGSAIGTLPTPIRTGYAFDGWYTAASGGTKITASTIVIGNVACYAHWISLPNPNVTTPNPNVTTPNPNVTTPNPLDTPVEAFVERLYTVVLGRPSDPDGKANHVNALIAHVNDGAHAAYGFFFSEELSSRGLSDEQWIDICYRTFLDREADADGRQNWLNALASGASRYFVFSGFVGSAEFSGICASYGIDRGSYAAPEARDQSPAVRGFVYRLYTECLGRNPEPDGLNNWCAALLSGQLSGTEVARGFFYSQEFETKYTTNTQVVTAAYKALLGRDPDPAGLADWVSRLDGGASKEVIFHGFGMSPEFKGICDSYGIRQGTIADPGAR